jgi:hypothetical protein
VAAVGRLPQQNDGGIPDGIKYGVGIVEAVQRHCGGLDGLDDSTIEHDWFSLQGGHDNLTAQPQGSAAFMLLRSVCALPA